MKWERGEAESASSRTTLDRGVGSASARLQREKEMGKAVWTNG